jgi:hypothetical protein
MNPTTEQQFAHLYDQLVQVRATLAVLKLVVHNLGLDRKVSRAFNKDAPKMIPGMIQEILKRDSAQLPDEEEKPRIIIPNGTSIVSGTKRGKA